MRMTFRSLAAVGGLLFGLALPASAEAYYAVTGGTVSLRAGAGTGFQRLAVIPGGSRIWVDFCRPAWCKATWRGISGWVSAAYVRGGVVESAPDYPYDYPYYDDYFYNDYFFYPHRPHRPHHQKPHCKRGHDCKPPKWDKPWHGKSPKWDGKPWRDKSPKWDKPWSDKQPPKWEKKSFDGPSKKWDRDWKSDSGPKLGGGFSERRFESNSNFKTFDRSDRGDRGSSRGDRRRDD
jgi:uncharacterized protein YraI